jgi:4-amino-4-deoxy-L-arabinose transferase-like glycosyltransferase
MNSVPRTAPPPAPAAPTGELPAVPGAARGVRERLRASLPLARHAGFVVVVGLSAVLNLHRLQQNGYANIFYSAGVRSMLRSLHNFVFVSFDPGGLIAVDKSPLGLWLQAASAKLFGYSPLSLLLPEALAGVLAVAITYILLARRLGAVTAFAGAFALAVFPSFVAVSRDNGVDPLLILLMVLACAAGVRASETGRLHTIIWCGALVGLAFNTKTLAAALVVPGIVLAYAVCAPGSIATRAAKLAAGGLAMLVVSFAWIALVELTPAAKRPYVGGSTNNTELGLTFEYNGFGRVGGQEGGPGQVILRPGARVVSPPAPHRRAPRHTPPAASGGSATPRTDLQKKAAAVFTQAAAEGTTMPGNNPTFLPNGRYRNPIPFGSTPSPVRLFGKGLGDQAGWIIPLALFGLIALARMTLIDARGRRRDGVAEPGVGEAVLGTPSAGGPGPGGPGPEHSRARTDAAARADGASTPAAVRAGAWRRDPRLATLLVMGGWFLVEAIVLSMSKGIVHPYYVAALAPAAAAMAGAGVVAIVRLRSGPAPAWGIVLAAWAVLSTVVVQAILLHREDYMLWLIPVLVGGGALGVGLFAARRSLAAPAMALTFALLLIAPTAYSTTTWWAPVEGTFPAAGPKAAAGTGALGLGGHSQTIRLAIARYVNSHRPGTRWTILTVASDSAAPFILRGERAGALGGYSGTDPAIDGPRLARLVAHGEARYVVLGGVYSTRGGNRATNAVLKACRLLAPSQWKSPDNFTSGLVLFDCAGRERALSAS